MRRIDIADGRRTAETLLAVTPEEIPHVILDLARSKRLSVAVRNLNELAGSSTERELGRRALRHLGFPDV